MVLFALYYPNREIRPWGLFNVKAKWLILFLIGIDLLFLRKDGVAHITHLGGALYGYLYFKFGHIFLNLGSHLTHKKKSWSEKKSEKSKIDTQITMEEIDPVLKKISEQGIESLTKSERKILDKASDLKKKQKSRIIKMDDYRRHR